jgi:hypothetical protein
VIAAPTPAHRVHTLVVTDSDRPVRPARLDHLVLAGPDLAAAADLVRRLTGLDPVEGGRHVGRGTRNLLLGLAFPGGAAYLEVIGPDPEQPDPSRPRPFGIDDLTGPRLVTWAVRPADLDAAVVRARGVGYDPGEPEAMARRTPDGRLLRWRLTPPWPSGPDDARHSSGGGVVPFLIDWGDTPHPTTDGLPSVPLIGLTGVHPDPEAVRTELSALGLDLAVARGPRPGLRALIAGTESVDGAVEVT